jgi:UDP-N-acetylmuramoylalanine--D-glutamate ligase
VQLAGKRVVVVGLGTSGIAAARVCVERGAHVIGTDSKRLEELPVEVRELGLELLVGGHAEVDFGNADLVVVSPGVPPFAALEAAERAGVEVIGELEFAWRLVRAPVLCVGGTNGKSTVTTLVRQLLDAAGFSVFSGGNLGTPLSEAVSGSHDWLVVETSSFQLERAPTFRPKVSILLNITEDHLDRYPDFEAYARAKGNAFVNQRPTDIAVIPTEDPNCDAQARRGNARRVRFGSGGDYEPSHGTVLEVSTGERFELATAKLHGAHNMSNAAAAIAAVRSQAVCPEAIREGLGRFEPLSHRMALVGTVGAVSFYDDSKATNVGAAVTALDGLQEPRAVLIAGGRDKLGSYAPLAEALERKGRALVVLGEAADKIARAVGDRLPVLRAATMNEAVRLAFEAARGGDAVLLSPACSSFDMFTSYADRGERFSEAVRALGRSTSEGAAR